jgi:hypothetical protein
MLAAASLTGSILLLAQKFLLSYLGMGSQYAVSKHVFFLATLAAASFAHSVFATRTSTPTARLNTGERLAAAPACFALVAYALLHWNISYLRQDLRPVLDYEAYATQYERFLQPVDGAANTVSLNKAFIPVINHLVSLGDLKLPYDVAQRSITSSSIVLSTPVKYAIVSTRSLDPGALKECSVGALASPNYTVVDRACFIDSLKYMLPDVPLLTGASDRGADYLTSGWSPPESWGTWSGSQVARIRFTVRPQPSNA